MEGLARGQRSGDEWQSRGEGQRTEGAGRTHGIARTNGLGIAADKRSLVNLHGPKRVNLKAMSGCLGPSPSWGLASS